MSSQIPNPFRRRISRRTALASGGAAAAFALVGCGGDDDDDESGSTPATAGTEAASPADPGSPVAGGTLHLAAGDVNHFDYQTTFTVLQSLFTNRLLRYSTGADVSPNHYESVSDLAASWEQPAPDQITFSLTPGVTFHDVAPVNGRALTSDDVLATFELLAADKPQYVYRYLVDFIDKVEAVDDQTVSIQLSYPTPLIFNTMAHYNSAIAPREIIDRDGNLEQNQIGTGPFIFRNYEKSIAYTFERNPSYFTGEGPYLDRVELEVIADANTQLDAFRSGRLHALDVQLSQLQTAQETLDEESSTVVTLPGVGWHAFWFNTLSKPFDDLRVRRAFSLALDRRLINSLATQDRAAIRTGPVARGWEQWARPDAEFDAEGGRDVAEARALLEAAGHGDGLDVTYLASSALSEAYGARPISEIAQQQLKEAGINLTFETTEGTAWNKRLQDHEFDFTYWVIRAYPDPDDYLYPFFVPDGSKNFGSVTDPDLEALILKQRQETDPEARRTVLQEIDRRWNQDFAYALWTIELPFNHVYSNNLQNYAPRNPLEYGGLPYVSLRES